MRTEMDRISMASLKGTPSQYVRLALAWLSKRYEKLTSRRGLAFLLPTFVALLAGSLLFSIPPVLRVPARLILPLLLNSLVISTLGDWVIGAFARRRGLGSLSTGGGGMGAVLGLMFTLNMLSILGIPEIASSQVSDMLILFAFMLVLAIFETALALGIMVAVSWITERLFKSYTLGFYGGFVAVMILELVLTILRQPAEMIGGI
jgi:hypothetical protein